MDFTPGTYALGFLAGALTTLSPCVLALVPVLVASALAAHRLGVVALSAGLGVSFSVIGIFVASVGASLGVDSELFRRVAAVLMILFGLAMFSHRLQAIFIRAAAGIGGSGQNWLSKIRGDTLSGQFAVGLILGAVWSPCVGPTLGAATTLASQSRSLGSIALLMGIFGIGASLPLTILGSLSRTSTQKLRRRLGPVGTAGTTILGAVFIAVGMLVLTGLDKTLETALLSASPPWLTDFTTSL
ncbi:MULTISPECIES: cytochrome c biogenesis CcdA family protein [Paraburkholderia]|jgi:cytochrome c-type biogenesis protein|uniref:Cytochrome c biogenesis CcdA family protein n=1 Tax=Paraburkholderia madseniana TaxID=2599607 RepID=A0A6N6WES9_9BURK|nr:MULTISPECIES: cytochrome c biogenesis CcdA family protein [Paraburkholderia]KAE8759023.1 cytochrome c biogenesis protein CcdA [Paraburkholderia madseniana]MCX4150763.1 cytochrome c biogenesis CcdA family protein [Paraburkholderia madseniana]MCX4171286.1 cytochrome c biogenesis CcdA family protein [Paraburkholderia madseniana]MDN7153696.1 cytochrome c biogenesis CcdA family protein [Paraburkholderia sp. WS6]MDQ6412578.1 cytochrome c biogenesis CcdA family protein [Paraburkholderia madseniana